jgi:hypothetical protein
MSAGQHSTLEFAGFAQVRRTIRHSVPQNQRAQVRQGGRSQSGHCCAKAERDHSQRTSTHALTKRGRRSNGVVAPAIQTPIGGIPGGVTAAGPVKAQHVKADGAQQQGELAESPVEALVFVTPGIA